MNNEDRQNSSIEILAANVADQLNNGVSRNDIVNSLIKINMRQTEAEIFVDNIINLRREAYRQEGTKDLIWGIVLIAIGVGITLATWAAAEPGGSYFILWGLISAHLW